MELDESEAVLRVQEKEKEYNAMKLDKLREIAIEENIDIKGDKITLIQRLVDKASGKKRSKGNHVLVFDGHEDILGGLKKTAVGSKISHDRKSYDEYNHR